MIAFGGKSDRGVLNEKVLSTPLLSDFAWFSVCSVGLEEDCKDNIRSVKDARTKVRRRKTLGVLMMAVM